MIISLENQEVITKEATHLARNVAPPDLRVLIQKFIKKRKCSNSSTKIVQLKIPRNFIISCPPIRGVNQ